jgi:hypothetical protein
MTSREESFKSSIEDLKMPLIEVLLKERKVSSLIAVPWPALGQFDGTDCGGTPDENCWRWGKAQEADIRKSA